MFPSRLRRILLVAVAPAFLSGACGRTEVPLPDEAVGEQTDYDVEVERDIELDDLNVVHVELVVPAPETARASLMGLPNGIPLEDVIDAVCPDGSPRVELDNTGEQPALLVRMPDGLRSVIWL